MGILRHAIDRALEIPAVYQAWQATHNREKIAFVTSRMQPRPGLRVVELGCGPGTNAHLFDGCKYLGIDINPNYITSAQRRFPQHTFVCADLLDYEFGQAAYDWVLVNSFLHHLDDSEVRATLEAIARIDTKSILVLELILPAQVGVARLLAKWDRGRYARPLEEWRSLAATSLAVREEAPIYIRRGRVMLYELVGFVLERRPGASDSIRDCAPAKRGQV